MDASAVATTKNGPRVAAVRCDKKRTVVDFVEAVGVEPWLALGDDALGYQGAMRRRLSQRWNSVRKSGRLFSQAVAFPPQFQETVTCTSCSFDLSPFMDLDLRLKVAKLLPEARLTPSSWPKALVSSKFQ